MKDPENNNNLIFSKEEIKSASLKYCVELLQNNVIDSDYANEIYIENLLHYYRTMTTVEEQPDEGDNLEYNDF